MGQPAAAAAPVVAAPPVIALLLAAALSWAQSEPDPLDYSFDPELFQPHADVYGYGVTHGASSLGHLQVGVGLWGNYSEDSLLLIAPDGRRIYVGDEPPASDQGDGVLDRRTVTDLQAGLGLGKIFSLTVDVPIILWQQGYELGNAWDTSIERDIVSAGVGDVHITPKFVILDLDDQPIGIAVLADVTAPTGRSISYMGEGEPTVMPMAVIELSDQPVRSREHLVRLAVNAGYRFRTAARYQELVIDDAIVYRAALGLSPSSNVELGVEAYGNLSGPELANRPLEVAPFVKLTPGDLFSIHGGAGFGLIPGVGSPDFRLFLGGTLQPSFNPRDLDRDDDGIQNNLDECPNIPEDFDGFEDDDGCPDPDNDGDGILDEADDCPNDPEDFDGYRDEDGCPDPDNDGDGILDRADRCPDQAETFNDYQDDDGCPDTAPVSDRDRDGYRDDVDDCPDEPEDFDGFEDDDGCPDPDNDGDGILDVDDDCPDEPEDFDGFQDDDGCPDLDRDGDGIDDDIDDCPDEPETVNGFEDDDGCPDTAPPTRVRVERTHIVIADKIHFEFDKSTIKPISYSLLDEIATVILDHPELARIQVEGHTDAIGDDAYNLDLSQRRAEAVVDYLVESGVDRSRLQPKGFGEQVPIADNETDQGRAKNRRVEFLILERDE